MQLLMALTLCASAVFNTSFYKIEHNYIQQLTRQQQPTEQQHHHRQQYYPSMNNINNDNNDSKTCRTISRGNNVIAPNRICISCDRSSSYFSSISILPMSNNTTQRNSTIILHWVLDDITADSFTNDAVSSNTINRPFDATSFARTNYRSSAGLNDHGSSQQT